MDRNLGGNGFWCYDENRQLPPGLTPADTSSYSAADRTISVRPILSILESSGTLSWSPQISLTTWSRGPDDYEPGLSDESLRIREIVN